MLGHFRSDVIRGDFADILEVLGAFMVPTLTRCAVGVHTSAREEREEMDDTNDKVLALVCSRG